jgi:hypothetical protein
MKKINRWYAKIGNSSGNNLKMGPFKTQAEAAKYVMKPDGFPADGAFIWPVTVQRDREKRK